MADVAERCTESSLPSVDPARSLWRYWILIPLIPASVIVVFLALRRGLGDDYALMVGAATLVVETTGVVLAETRRRRAASLINGRAGTGAHRPKESDSAVARWLFRRKLFAVLTAVALGLAAAVYCFVQEREPDPDEYMSGIIRIGYVDPGYPGFTKNAGAGGAGFDTAVAEAVKDEFPNATQIEWVPLEDLAQRIEALQGPWGKSRIEPVHLVVNNVSITEARKKKVDLAGPYYVDMEGFATHDKNARMVHDLKKVCVSPGSAAEERLQRLGVVEIIRRKSLEACFDEYNDDPNMSVSTDLSIIQAYSGSRRLTTSKGKQNVSDDSDLHFVTVGAELYGVGMPNNRPRLCERVNAALQRFIDVSWAAEFDKTLKPLGVTRLLPGNTDHRPSAVKPCEPAGNWRK